MWQWAVASGATVLGWEGLLEGWEGLLEGLGSAIVLVPGALGVFVPCPHLVQPLQVTNRRETAAQRSSPGDSGLELRLPVWQPPGVFLMDPGGTESVVASVSQLARQQVLPQEDLP